MKSPKTRKEYIEWYHDLYLGHHDTEVSLVGEFLVKNVKGKVLDCGCGPVPQIWAICMPQSTEIHAIDVVPESIQFVNVQLARKKQLIDEISNYKEIAENTQGKLPKDYLMQQLNKIKSVKLADMTKKIPYRKRYFDTVLSLYSLGVLSNNAELDNAVKNISNVIKKNGKLLHVNSNGKNSNIILPEYTWKGLPQASKALRPLLQKYGFTDIKISEFRMKSTGTYKYDKIYLLSATKR